MDKVVTVRLIGAVTEGSSGPAGRIPVRAATQFEGDY